MIEFISNREFIVHDQPDPFNGQWNDFFRMLPVAARLGLDVSLVVDFREISGGSPAVGDKPAAGSAAVFGHGQKAEFVLKDVRDLGGVTAFLEQAANGNYRVHGARGPVYLEAHFFPHDPKHKR